MEFRSAISALDTGTAKGLNIGRAVLCHRVPVAAGRHPTPEELVPS